MKISDFKTPKGQRIRMGWGLAWANFDRAESIYLPIPFNILASFIRRVYFLAVRAFYPTKIDRILRKERQIAWGEGYNLGLKEGEFGGRMKYEKELLQRLDAHALEARQKINRGINAIK